MAFFASGKLKKISLEGGAPIALCDYSAPPRGGSWGEDGTIIAALGNYDALSRIPSAGGASALVAQLAQGEATQRWPQFCRVVKAVLFTSHTTAAGFDRADIEVVTLADKHQKTLQRGGTFGRYLPGANGIGYLIYINKGTMLAVLRSGNWKRVAPLRLCWRRLLIALLRFRSIRLFTKRDACISQRRSESTRSGNRAMARCRRQNAAAASDTRCLRAATFVAGRRAPYCLATVPISGFMKPGAMP